MSHPPATLRAAGAARGSVLKGESQQGIMATSTNAAFKNINRWPIFTANFLQNGITSLSRPTLLGALMHFADGRL